jgi:hypothetical protein
MIDMDFSGRTLGLEKIPETFAVNGQVIDVQDEIAQSRTGNVGIYPPS